MSLSRIQLIHLIIIFMTRRGCYHKVYAGQYLNFSGKQTAIADQNLQRLKSASCGKSYTLADGLKRHELILRKE